MLQCICSNLICLFFGGNWGFMSKEGADVAAF